MKKLIIVLCAGFVYANTVHLTAQPADPETNAAQEPGVIVSASKSNATLESMGNSVEIITAETIRKKGIQTVKEALATLRGISVSAGSTTSVYVRGSDNGQLLVLIDGVPAYDPASVDRGFDFSRLSVLNIERIEVIYGPESALYGSTAVAGVVNIVTVKGSSGRHLIVKSENGSDLYFGESVSYTDSTENTSVSFGAERRDKRGESQASPASGDHTHFDNDGSHETEISGRFTASPSIKSALDMTVRYIDSSYDVDVMANMDDRDQVSTNRLFTGGLSYRYDFTSWFTQKYLITHTSSKRTNIDKTTPDLSYFDGSLNSGELRNIFAIGSISSVMIGIQYSDESASAVSDRDDAWGSRFFPERVHTLSGYANGSLNAGKILTINAGARYDKHNEFGSAWTYSTSGVITAPDTNTKLRASIGSSFLAPSLFQLYAPIYGNSKLKPEKGVSSETGIEQPFGKIGKIGATYFRSHYSERIGVDEITYVNTGETRIHGWEIYSTLTPFDWIEFSGSYTNTKSEDADGKNLLKRPEHKANASASYTGIPGLVISPSYEYVGKCTDYGDKKLDSYWDIGLFTSYDINPQFSIYAKGENLTNNECISTYGYTGKTRKYLVGVKGTF